MVEEAANTMDTPQGTSAAADPNKGGLTMNLRRCSADGIRGSAQRLNPVGIAQGRRGSGYLSHENASTNETGSICGRARADRQDSHALTTSMTRPNVDEF